MNMFCTIWTPYFHIFVQFFDMDWFVIVIVYSLDYSNQTKKVFPYLFNESSNFTTGLMWRHLSVNLGKHPRVSSAKLIRALYLNLIGNISWNLSQNSKMIWIWIRIPNNFSKIVFFLSEIAFFYWISFWNLNKKKRNVQNNIIQ